MEPIVGVNKDHFIKILEESKYHIENGDFETQVSKSLSDCHNKGIYRLFF